MTGLLWAGLTLAVLFLMAALADLVSEEIRGWLDLAPRAILRLAATQLDAHQRENIYQDEWLPELTYALRGAEARPITRLITGIKYSIGILIAARRIARRLSRAPQLQRTSPPSASYLSALTQAGHTITNPSSRMIRLDGLCLNVDLECTEIGPGRILAVTTLSRDEIIECRKRGLEVRNLYGPSDYAFYHIEGK